MIQLLCNTIPLLGQETGIGRYTRQIAQGLLASERFETTFFYGWQSKRLLARHGTATWLAGLKSILAKHRRIFFACKKLFFLCSKAGQNNGQTLYDCYFEPNFILFPSLRAKHKVITVHDFSCFLYPQWHPAERVRYLEKNLPTSLAEAEKIITPTEAIRQEAIKIFNLVPERVLTIHNGLDHNVFYSYATDLKAKLRKQYKLPAYYLLYVGAMEPRKNLQTLLDAYKNLPAPLRRTCPLLLAGGQGWANDSLRTQISQSDQIRILGYVTEKQLAVLYNLATIFIYPSWYEGFGLPVVEAMACGCPVVTSTDAALLEVCQGAALHLSPDNTELFSETVQNLLKDEQLRLKLRTHGLQRAKDFSWQDSVFRHLNLFQQICT